MRPLIWIGGSAVAAVLLLFGWMFWYTGMPSMTGEFLTTVVIVPLSTFACIAFAVVTYMEAEILSGRISRMNHDLENRCAKQMEELSRLQEKSADAMLSLISGLRMSIMLLPKESPDYQQALRGLSAAEIQALLLKGDPKDVMKAIDLSFKYERTRGFMNLEWELCDKTTGMPAPVRDRLRRYYDDRKRLKVPEMDAPDS